MPVQLKYLGPPVGFYVSDIGPLNQFVHLWGYDDLADYDRRRKARDADPEWPAYLAASEHLIVAQENRFIRRIDLRSLRERPDHPRDFFAPCAEALHGPKRPRTPIGRT